MVVPGTDQSRLKELEHRVNDNFFEVDKKLEDYEKFESRSNVNFFEIEKRLVELEKSLEERKPAGEARVKEMEDLLMMLEIELVKLKEKLSRPQLEEVSEGVVSGVPSISEDRIFV